MKTLQLAIVLLLSLAAIPVKAQNEADVLRFSQSFNGGTARFMGMGGAFGALGGDMTSLSLNPAGIGVYRASEFTFTPTVNIDNTSAKFYGTSYTDSKYKFNLNNIGYVYTMNTNKDEGWVSASFGIAYNRLNDFNRNTLITGNNPSSSMLDYFRTNLNKYLGNAPVGVNEDMGPIENDLQKDYGNYEYLAYKTDAVFVDQTYGKGYFVSDYDLANTRGENQQRTITTKGGIGEYAFSFGANYSHKLYLGLTIGVDQLQYDEIKTHTETGVPGNYLDNFTFTENFTNTGTGYNFKLGLIYKPINLLRLGFAFHTPTFYNLSSEFYTSMDANYKQAPANVYKSTSISTYDYNVTTPLKIITSVALQFQQFGVLSVDYEFVDYSKAKIRADDWAYTDINTTIQNVYIPTGNLKIGGEAKLGDFALRVGYGFYGSPYESNQLNKDASTTSYSCGFGYRGRSFFFDVGYITFNTKYKHMLYDYKVFNPNDPNGQPSILETTDLNSKSGRVAMTFGFRF